jgi:hypothetical protein
MRTVEKVYREYGGDKWLKCLEAAKNGTIKTAQESYTKALGFDENIFDTWYTDIKCALQLTTMGSKLQIVELGSGTGMWESLFTGNYIGAELTAEGVECSEILKTNPDNKFMQINLLDVGDLKRLKAACGDTDNIHIISCQAFEQIPDCSTVLQNIKDILNPKAISLIEPLYEISTQLQKDYMDKHDYVRNLVSSMIPYSDENSPLSFEYNIAQMKPEMILSMIEWYR